MATSPNSATRSRTSSPATPDGLFEETIDSSSCSHISNLLSDTAESEPVLKTFRRAVAWKAQRTHDALHSAKRRKVRCRSVLVAQSHTNTSTGCVSDMWNLWINNATPICMPRMCLLRLLARRAYSGAPERRGSQVLCVFLYIPVSFLNTLRCRYAARYRVLQRVSGHDP